MITEKTSMNRPVFQVSELVEVVNRHLDLLGEIVVEGEISRIDVKSNRLIFATIKDSNSAIDVFGLTHQIHNVRQLEAGMKVQVVGFAGLYKGSGRFRLQASSISPLGEGAMQLALDKLKQQLENEGLFDDSHKRELPSWPQQIGLITASGSSAYFDVVKILTTRMGGLTIKHLPVTVQGMQAVPSILKALEFVNKQAVDFEVVIMTRGGGSMEDLQAFNDERLVRAVFACKVPVVSAVGHEDDWSLLDYVADVRASTPSNAAELVVNDRAESLFYIDSTVRQLRLRIKQELMEKKHQIREAVKITQVQFSYLIDKITIEIEKIVREKTALEYAFNTFRSQLHLQAVGLYRQTHNQFVIERQKLAGLMRVVESMDVAKILQRGFSISRDENGDIVNSATQLHVGTRLYTTLAKGTVSSTITQLGDTND